MAGRSFHGGNPRQLVPENPTNTGNLRSIKPGRSCGMKRNPIHRQLATLPPRGSIFRSNKKFFKHTRLRIWSHKMSRLVRTAAPAPLRKRQSTAHRGVAGGFQNHTCGTLHRQHPRATRTQGPALGISRHTADTAHGRSQNGRNCGIRCHRHHHIQHSRGNK